MSWLTLHKASEDAAAAACELMHEGRTAEARRLYAEAAQKEQQALECLNAAEKPRTFAITAVSAGALWYKAGDFAKARCVAESALRVPGLMDFAVDQLHELIESIDRSQRK
jgi:hypothetical protein